MNSIESPDSLIKDTLKEMSYEVGDFIKSLAIDLTQMSYDNLEKKLKKYAKAVTTPETTFGTMKGLAVVSKIILKALEIFEAIAEIVFEGTENLKIGIKALKELNSAAKIVDKLKFWICVSPKTEKTPWTDPDISIYKKFNKFFSLGSTACSVLKFCHGTLLNLGNIAAKIGGIPFLSPVVALPLSLVKKGFDFFKDLFGIVEEQRKIRFLRKLRKKAAAKENKAKTKPCQVSANPQQPTVETKLNVFFFPHINKTGDRTTLPFENNSITVAQATFFSQTSGVWNRIHEKKGDSKEFPAGTKDLVTESMEDITEANLYDSIRDAFSQERVVRIIGKPSNKPYSSLDKKAPIIFKYEESSSKQTQADDNDTLTDPSIGEALKEEYDFFYSEKSYIDSGFLCEVKEMERETCDLITTQEVQQPQEDNDLPSLVTSARWGSELSMVENDPWNQNNFEVLQNNLEGQNFSNLESKEEKNLAIVQAELETELEISSTLKEKKWMIVQFKCQMLEKQSYLNLAYRVARLAGTIFVIIALVTSLGFWPFLAISAFFVLLECSICLYKRSWKKKNEPFLQTNVAI
ncbi:hypothetical protein BN1013_00972 [Candidatus Rubidus massiliensis]|nr:hypothetical protein BN1013_00972 [Candidatus Rubidus massiliensis]